MVTNLEIGYVKINTAGFYDLYVYNTQYYILILGTSSYKIEEEMDGIYNAVLNSSLLL